ncbi:MAG: CsbD family protein [Bacteroidetes bacterium]|nr:CsbD family protein [Bacteroidota bacterium]
MDVITDVTEGSYGAAAFDALDLRGQWNNIKGKLKQKYSQLTDDDLEYMEGKENELIGRLQRKLGKTKNQIMDLINSFISEKSY